ncbi:MAG: arylesterase [Campylobacterales bacterium]|nr:arylesterase [Campylobacterales bacterium]
MGIIVSVLVAIAFKNTEMSHKEFYVGKNSVILAFGDSLTFGYGAQKTESYPSYMEQKTGVRVINAGINGELSATGLKRLPRLLKEYDPNVVILCHGGNDILQKRSQDELKKNLLEMVALIKESGADVLLVGVPEFSSYSFGVLDIYEEIARESSLVLEDSVLTKIELDRRLKSDYVHPNAKGYALMAETFIDTLGIKRLE